MFPAMQTSISTDYNFALLPPHIIAQILKNLPFHEILNASQICKSWYFAACDPMLSNRVRVRISKQYDRLAELNRPFGSLVLSYSNFNEFDFKKAFKKFRAHITEIVLLNCTLSAKQLADCIFIMTNLIILKIVPKWDTFTSAVDLIESDVVAIKPVLSRIKHFSVLHSYANAKGLQMFMDLMPHLKTLCFGPYTVDANEPCKFVLSYSNLCNLNSLEIQNLSMLSTVNFLQDFSKITAQLNLNSFALSTKYSDVLCISHYDENFKNVCKKLSNLKIFSMNWVGENQLSAICRYMTKLIDLNLTNINTHQIREIGNLRNLEKLNLKDLNETVPEDEAEMFSTLVNLKNLEIDFEISDVVLNKICTNCKYLTRLNLSRMQTGNLEILFKNLRQLTHLDLEFEMRKCNFFKIEHDITNLQLLKHVDVNILVSGMSVALFEKLPNLRETSLENLRNKFEIKMKRPLCFVNQKLYASDIGK